MNVRGWFYAAFVTSLVTCGIASLQASGPIGGCPAGGAWQLVDISDYFEGVSPEVLAGIASLDGNGDGWTCVRPAGQSVTFRDNTVQGPR